MSFSQSALLLSWIAILFLSIGFASIVRQIRILSVAGSSAGSTRRSMVGFGLPTYSRIREAVSGHDLSIVLCVTPACVSCRDLLRECVSRAEFEKYHVVVVSSGVIPNDLEPPNRWDLLERAGGEHDLLGLPGTPYFSLVDSEGRILFAGLAGSVEEVLGEAGSISGNESSLT